MNTSKMILAAALGFGSLSIGCIGTGGDRENDSDPATWSFDDVSYMTHNDPGGQQGNNGLKETIFNDCRDEVASALAFQLTDPADPAIMSKDVASIFDLANPSAPCKKALEYTVRCAAPKSCSVHYDTTQPPMTGAEFLDTGWCDAGITDTTVKEEVMACVAAHVNGSSLLNITPTVPIELSGIPIVPSAVPYDESEFNCDEALWVAEHTRRRGYVIHSWSLGCVEFVCGGNISLSMWQRLCGQGECGFEYHGSAQGAPDCTPDPQDPTNFAKYTCKDRSVIMTRLKAADVDDLHGVCSVPL